MVRYEKALRKQAKEMGLKLVTVAVGTDFEIQVGVTKEKMQDIMRQIMTLEDDWNKAKKEYDERPKQTAGPGVLTGEHSLPSNGTAKKEQGSGNTDPKPTKAK